MSKLHPSYECRCQIPTPLIWLGQDTGLCKNCDMVYDERLYEMRVREHVANWTWDSLHDALMELDPNYQRVVATQPVA